MIQRATKHHLDALLHIENTCFDYDKLSRRHFRYMLTKAKAKTLIHIEKKRITGYTLLFTPKHPKPARLYSLAVLPEFRKQGIASLLIEAAKTEAKNQGYTTLILEVRASHQKVIHLYQSHGFTITRRISTYYEDGEDAFKMSCAL